MGRNKPRPTPQPGKPQGEQTLGGAAWAQIVKTIRELSGASLEVPRRSHPA